MKKEFGQFAFDSAKAGLAGSGIIAGTAILGALAVNLVTPITTRNVWAIHLASGLATLGVGFAIQEKHPNAGFGCGAAGMSNSIGALLYGLFSGQFPDRPIFPDRDQQAAAGLVMPPRAPDVIHAAASMIVNRR